MNILLVDDHALFRAGLSLLLESIDGGSRIFEAEGFDQALTLLAGQRFELAIVDYQLQGRSGLELLQEVKRHYPDLPVVIMSGSDDTQMIRNVLEMGASGFLPKSMKPADITRALTLVIKGACYVPVSVLALLKQPTRDQPAEEAIAHLAEISRDLLAVDVVEQPDKLADALKAMLEERLRLERLAYCDNLTGLANRALFNDRLNQAFARFERSGECFALVLIDLDDFKPVNDQYGHRAGDALLAELAQRFQNSIRASDTAARFGGDEFALLMPETSKISDLQGLIERMREGWLQVIEFEGLMLEPKLSIGAALVETGDKDSDLIERTDRELYRAKDNGKNCFCIASGESL